MLIFFFLVFTPYSFYEYKIPSKTTYWGKYKLNRAWAFCTLIDHEPFYSDAALLRTTNGHMGRINENNMASVDEKQDLSSRLVNLKSRINLSYLKLNARLGKPCGTTTLHSIVVNPKTRVSKKLLQNINDAISRLKSTNQQAASKKL